MNSAIGVALAMIALVPTTATAQKTHPDFSGTWTMDPARSDPSSITPASSIYVVVQHGDTITVDRANTSAPSAMMPDPVTLKSHLVWATDGKEWKNILPLVGAEVPTVTTAAWAGDTMTVHIAGTVNGQDLVQDDRWSLSVDGSTLALKRVSSYGGSVIASPKLVFVKR